MDSWVDIENPTKTHFPLENLPYGVFSVANEAPRCCTAIGNYVLDLASLEAADLIKVGGGRPVFAQNGLNAFMALGNTAWGDVRAQLTDLLLEGGNPALRENLLLRESALHPLVDVGLHLPFKVAEFTDFYSARQHAFNVGSMFRGPENALPPNWLHIPIGYNGRASTVVVSGTPVRRPLGQVKPHGADAPSFRASRRLDIELEMGTVVGLPNEFGAPVTVAQADEMIFGYVLLNDWSARDIQAWEYQPLGPFQAKAFATTISPWVVTKAALEPFRVATPEREYKLFPYLQESGPLLYDITLDVLMQPEGAERPTRIARSNFRHLYYAPAQQLTHHAVSGCKMNTGDLLGTGTISGPQKHEYGSLLELTWGGKEPISLDTGETRTFLEDGDIIELTGWAEGDGHRIGFGSCAGKILPAPTMENW